MWKHQRNKVNKLIKEAEKQLGLDKGHSHMTNESEKRKQKTVLSLCKMVLSLCKTVLKSENRFEKQKIGFVALQNGFEKRKTVLSFFKTVLQSDKTFFLFRFSLSFVVL